MTNQGVKTKKSDKKEEKGEKKESERSDSTKGYEDQDVRDMILGLSTRIDNFMLEMDIMKDNMRALNNDKIDIDDVNRVNDLLEDKIADVLQIAAVAKDKAVDVEIETNNIKINTLPHPLPPSPHLTSTPLKSAPTTDKCKLATVQSLNTK